MLITKVGIVAGLASLLSACVTQSSQLGPVTMNTVNSGPASAYQGTVGDWALGQWNGIFFIAGDRGALRATEGYLLVERPSDGLVICKAGAEGQVRTMRTCTITATTIDIVGPSGNTAHLERMGPDDLKGVWVFMSVTGARNETHLKRAS